MPPLAQAALAASIVLSALGAIVICLLTAVYGFTPPSEESPRQTTRRLFLTRVGHAVAASCFAATAILLAIVLAQPRAAAPTSGDARVPGLASKLDAQVQRLEGVERRMKDSEQTLQRLEMEVSDVASQRNAPAAAVAPTRAPEPRMPAPSPEKPRASLAPKPAERTTAAAKPAGAPKPAASAARPAEILPAPPPKSPTSPAASASKPADATPAPPRASEPASATGPSADRPAGDEPAASPAPRAASATPRTRDTPPPPRDFPSKLREDWRAIRKAWDSAGDDFRAAIDRLRNGGN